MGALVQLPKSQGGDSSDENLFGLIAEDLYQQGYSVRAGVLPLNIADPLFTEQQGLHNAHYVEAGIGRGDDFVKTEFVRTDEICWINEASQAGENWLAWTSHLQHFLNQRLFLGLFSFESHYAHYAPGAYYKRHYDAFRGGQSGVVGGVLFKSQLVG